MPRHRINLHASIDLKKKKKKKKRGNINGDMIDFGLLISIIKKMIGPLAQAP